MKCIEEKLLRIKSPTSVKHPWTTLILTVDLDLDLSPSPSAYHDHEYHMYHEPTYSYHFSPGLLSCGSVLSSGAGVIGSYGRPCPTETVQKKKTFKSESPTQIKIGCTHAQM